MIANANKSAKSGTSLMRVRRELLQSIDRARGDLTRADYLDSLLSGNELPSVYGQLSDIGEKIANLAEGIARLTYTVDIIKESLKRVDPDLHMALDSIDRALNDEITGVEFIGCLDELSPGLREVVIRWLKRELSWKEIMGQDEKEGAPLTNEKRVLLLELLQAGADRDMLDWTEDERKEAETMARTIRERLKKPSE